MVLGQEAPKSRHMVRETSSRPTRPLLTIFLNIQQAISWIKGERYAERLVVSIKAGQGDRDSLSR